MERGRAFLRQSAARAHERQRHAPAAVLAAFIGIGRLQYSVSQVRVRVRVRARARVAVQRQ